MATPEPGLSERELPEVACLEAFWAAHVAGGIPLDPMVGKLLLDTLGLGNQQVFRFLYGEGPDFDRFRQWIVETAGMPDPVLLSRYHCWLTEQPLDDAATAQLAQIAALEPVLDEAALSHWESEGFVVLKQALTPEEAAAVRELVWSEAGASPDDPESWYGERDDGIMIARFQHPAQETARRSPRIHKAFAQLLGTGNLWVTIDRLGFNPPVRPSHPFAGSGLHWDVSLARPIPLGAQAVLYLCDTVAEQGAFRCVPGFHHRIDAWIDEVGEANARKIDLSREQVFVPGSAGDLVIWRQDLPHGASSNRSTRPRLAQYLTCYSPDMPIRSRWV